MKKTDTPANRGGYGPAYTEMMKRNYRRWAAKVSRQLFTWARF
jgi:hypothetical protein